MNRQLSIAIIALAIVAGPAFAQGAHDHSHGSATQAAPAAPASSVVNGEVRKVDKEQGKLTLAHDPIPNLEMPKMSSMVYRVKDKAMLDQVKAGDKVKLAADRVDGQLTVVAVERIR